MGDAPQMPQPTAEHQQITGAAGRWNVQCRWFMDPSQPPMENTATEEVTAVGPFHVTTRFSCDMFGVPFEGRATISYDPFKQRYVSTWMDSVNPMVWHFEGARDDQQQLVMHADGRHPMTQEPTRFRSLERDNPDGSRHWEMGMELPDGSWFTMMEYRYTRA